MEQEPPLVVARAVCRRYGRREALEETDLEVRPGETVVVVGPNGAGKSTLLAILAGALAPSGGRVEGPPPAAIGWAPQRPAQYRRLTARENLELFARLLRLADPQAETERLLRELDVPDDRRLVSELSVGTQQRLNLALCFLGAPMLLLLDEPTASLDPRRARALWSLLEGQRELGAGVVVATHLLEEAARADRVLALEEGRVVFDGSPAAFRELPA